jgi:hypothetical protein
MSDCLDQCAVDVVQNIARKASQPGKGFDLAVVILLFAIIFKFLPDAKIQRGDVWIGAVMTAIFFAIGKWALDLYLGSGSAASAYRAASSFITLLLWVYYSSQILLFGAEFTQIYACRAGRCAGRTCDADLRPRGGWGAVVGEIRWPGFRDLRGVGQFPPQFSKLSRFWGRCSRAERRPTTRSRYFPKPITISCKQRRAATMSCRA